MATPRSHLDQSEERYCGAVVGQIGSSARCETVGWIYNLTLPLRSLYATDSASMLSKAKKMVQVASKAKPKRPLNKTLVLQRDGDL